ncbi:MAG: DUF84 family protein [Planctomycetes bacterium]|nr:DUF84 family protein [Planctomycetota bacterium]
MPFVVRSVAVGSRNPVKIAAVRAMVERAAPNATIVGLEVPSGVAAQPFGDDETIRGATNRARAARDATAADLGIGIEGGCIDTPAGMRTCAWAVVVDREDRIGTGGSLNMPLPPRVAAMIRSGLELGHAIDALIAQSGTKHGAGAVGVLTAGLVDRQRAYEPLIAYALAPFLASDWWLPE